MTPAQQRLKASDRTGAHVDQWLIEQLELAGLECLAKIELQQPARLHLRVHLRLEQSIDAAAVDLCTIERQIGILQDLVIVGPILWGERNADAGADHDLVASHIERCVEQREYPVGDVDCFGRLLDRRLDDGEFIATKPSNGIRLA